MYSYATRSMDRPVADDWTVELLDGIILDLYTYWLWPVLWMKNSRDVVNGGKE